MKLLMYLELYQFQSITIDYKFAWMEQIMAQQLFLLT